MSEKPTLTDALTSVFDALRQVGEAATSEITAMLPPSRDELIAMLVKSEKQFRFYAVNHREKGTPDGLSKALVNEKFADEIQALLVRCQ